MGCSWEKPLGAIQVETTLDVDSLPLELAGLSHCFRAEAGAHGHESHAAALRQFYGLATTGLGIHSSTVVPVAPLSIRSCPPTASARAHMF